MLSIFDKLRDVSLISMCIRLILAVVCGSIIGIEREIKRRPAGFRTHILICTGAAMTTLISEYLLVEMNYTTDIARLGAQVIAGIGFIGAGTIIVTRHQRVKGLTTAAGLWAVAIVGLAIGLGFYEGALVTTLLILMAEMVFSKLEKWITRKSREINLMVEYTSTSALNGFLQWLKQQNVKVQHLEITRSTMGGNEENSIAIFSLRLHKKCSIDRIMEYIGTIQSIVGVEEL